MTPFAVLTKDAIKIKDYFIKSIQEKYSVQLISLYENTDVLIIEDSLLILISIKKFPGKYLPVGFKDLDCSSVEFEELSYNTIEFKHNHTKFLTEVYEKLGIYALNSAVSYQHFKGFTRPYWKQEEKTTLEKVADEFPELKIKERYDSWQGIEYNFILFRVKDFNENIIYASTYTINKPYSYINDLVNGWIKHGFRYKMGNIFPQTTSMSNAFESYKNSGISRKDRIENNLSYYSYSKFFKEKEHAIEEVYKILDRISDNSNFRDVEFTSYIKPTNQWKSEELVYKLTRKIYKEYEVIYQHQPFFLKSDKGGQMSYDIFITKLNVAIEYQGKQHFEPVEFFGGEKSFREGQKRDSLKKELSEKHGIKLVYINYWEDINEQLIKEKVEG